MTRKRLAMVFFLLSTCCGFWLQQQGEMPAHSVPAFLLSAAAGAFEMPGSLVAFAVARIFGADASPYVVALSLAFWLFPLSRLRRYAGIYNPFADSTRRRPVLSSAVAFVLDEADKRLFGRQKTGGWA